MSIDTSLSAFSLKHCPKCNKDTYGNYCSECGTLLEPILEDMECPCCHGKGKISRSQYNPYSWKNWWNYQDVVTNQPFNQPIVKY